LHAPAIPEHPLCAAHVVSSATHVLLVSAWWKFSPQLSVAHGAVVTVQLPNPHRCPSPASTPHTLPAQLFPLVLNPVAHAGAVAAHVDAFAIPTTAQLHSVSPSWLLSQVACPEHTPVQLGIA